MKPFIDYTQVQQWFDEVLYTKPSSIESRLAWPKCSHIFTIAMVTLSNTSVMCTSWSTRCHQSSLLSRRINRMPPSGHPRISSEFGDHIFSNANARNELESAQPMTNMRTKNLSKYIDRQYSHKIPCAVLLYIYNVIWRTLLHINNCSRIQTQTEWSLS